MSKVVLVVDDEPGIVAVLSRLLSDEGWTVQAAHDGAEALLVVGRTAPSVILLDYIMPVMDGAAVAAALDRDATTRRIPIVVMSGLPESMIKRKIKRYAAYVKKPFAFDELVATLARTARASSRGPGKARSRSAK